MSHTIESFSQQCHDILKAEPNPAGREKVRALLSEVLKDDDFVAKHFGPDNTDPRKCLYEDPDMGFCIFAHVHTGAKVSPPHDHGHAWAIYGQADGVTEMNEWDLISAPDGDKPGKVKLNKTYTMRRGDAYVYNEKELHSPSRDKPTKLIRIEGTNLDFVKRDRFEPVDEAAAAE
jgi:predicted metal-dependent enzyme (double-stranded beta helix superfamily)